MLHIRYHLTIIDNYPQDFCIFASLSIDMDCFCSSVPFQECTANSLGGLRYVSLHRKGQACLLSRTVKIMSFSGTNVRPLKSFECREWFLFLQIPQQVCRHFWSSLCHPVRMDAQGTWTKMIMLLLLLLQVIYPIAFDPAALYFLPAVCDAGRLIC